MAALEVCSQVPRGAWGLLGKLVKAGDRGLPEPCAERKVKLFLTRHGYAATRREHHAAARTSATYNKADKPVKVWVYHVTQLGIEQHQRLQSEP